MDRRTFVATAGASAALVITPRHVHGAQAAGLPVTLDLTATENAALVPVGGSRYVTVAGMGQPIIVVRLSASAFSAFSSVCTHLGCRVNLPAAGVCVCPCHDSRFSTSGTVVNGPAVSDLQQFPASLSGNSLTIGGSSAVAGQESPQSIGVRVELDQAGGAVRVKIAGSALSGEYRVVNVNGRTVAHGQLRDSNGFSFSTANRPAGLYVAHINAPGRELSAAFRIN